MLTESAFVPVPVAATGTVFVGIDEEVVDDNGCPVLPDRTFWISCESCVLTRFSAVELAMLARPLPRLASAELIAPMTASVAAMELLVWFCGQEAWSCCQNDCELPMVLMELDLPVFGQVMTARG